MQLTEIRDFIATICQDNAWHFIEGKLEDMDKYVDIKQRKVLMSWEGTTGEWINRHGTHNIVLFFGEFMRMDEMNDKNKTNAYKTNKWDKMVSEIQSVLTQMFDQTVANPLVPQGSYEFGYFEKRFKEDLQVVSVVLEFKTLDFYCSNPYGT